MGNYYDIDDILAEEESFQKGANEVGIDPSAEAYGVEPGSKVKLPFWLAYELHVRQVLTMKLPACFNQQHIAAWLLGMEFTARHALQMLDQVFPQGGSCATFFRDRLLWMGAHPSGLGPHVPLPEYLENMRMIASHIQSLSDSTHIIVLSCPPVDETTIRANKSPYLSELVRTNELCQQYSEACIKLCQEMDIKVVDLFTAIQKGDNCFTDGIHLSAEGSKIVAEEILKVLREADWMPSLHWKSMPTEFPEDSPYDLVAADGKTTINPSEWTFYIDPHWKSIK